MLTSWPKWYEIQEQIERLEQTGRWPHGQIPGWAVDVAGRLHCSTGNVAVVEAGLREIIRQLKEENEGLRRWMRSIPTSGQP